MDALSSDVQNVGVLRSFDSIIPFASEWNDSAQDDRANLGARYFHSHSIVPGGFDVTS
jgi:hypothetical protein